MTISSREKEVPTRLVAARLYLDDIEEIRDIILQAAASRVVRPETDRAELAVESKFYIGDQVCTEVQDLPKIKKRTRDFEMRLSAPDGFSARCKVGEDGIQWTSNGLTKADTWRTFHKLETVLERRKIRWRRFLPGGQLSALFLSASFLILMILAFGSVISAIFHRPPPSDSALATGVVVVVVITVFTQMALASLSHSEVVLRYSWEHAAQREDRNTKIVIAGVSALIAFILGIASLALKHKYWP